MSTESRSSSNSPRLNPSPTPSDSAVTMNHLTHMYHQLMAHQDQQIQQVLAAIQAPRTMSANSTPNVNPIFQHGFPVSQTPLPVKVKISPPSNFSGTREVNVDSWLFEMVQYLNACGVAEDQRVGVASSYLKNNALQWWFTQNQLSNAQRPSTWDAFATAVRLRFQPVAASREARAQLRSLRQDKMSVSEYCSKFHSLINMIPDMSEADQIEIFSFGLRPSLQRDVAIQDPTSLNDAMIKAQKMESIHNLNDPRRSSYNFAPFSNSFSSNSSLSTRHGSPSSSSTASTPGSTVPMELGAMSMESEAEPTEMSEYERYIELGDDYQQEETDSEQVDNSSKEEESTPHLQVLSVSSRSSDQRRNNAPFLSEAEFTRRMREGLCLRCARTGHVARNCPTRSANSYQNNRPNPPRPPLRNHNGQFQSRRNF